MALVLLWIRNNIVPVIIIVALLIAALLFAAHEWQRAHTQQAVSRLDEAQKKAAVESGSDAVQTISNTQAGEVATHDEVSNGTRAIDAAVGGNSNDAADRAACRMRSYRHSSKCVALLGPAAE